ncbi:MAG: 2-dehydropantoate 2-reductase [Gammaproteobacteria bacterium]|nr:2-dehydropantoate 2-reductase [Gammaproteobacteria bacterium]
MTICVFGAGAIGCWLAARLQRAGLRPSLVARGDHLRALRTSGLRITEDGHTETLQVNARGVEDDLPPQDLIIVTLKAHSITSALDHLTSLCHDETVLVFGVNGIPWWFFHGMDGPFAERTIASVDPGNQIWEAIKPQRAIGCVLYPAAELLAPGEVQHVSGNRISLGEPSGKMSARVEEVMNVLLSADIRASVRRDIRNEIWIKLWGNVAFNPLSVLTGATLDHLATNPGTNAIARRLMEETQTIGASYGARFGMTIDKRLQGAAAVGPHKTSMLQDYLHGKPLESSAMLDGVLELGELAQIEAPTIRMMQAMLAMKLASERHPNNS